MDKDLYSGDALQRFCINHAHQYLDGFGFMDGGCAYLAHALSSLFEVNVVGICSKNGIEHMAVFSPETGLFLDADGVSSRAGMLEKMLVQELVVVTDVLPVSLPCDLGEIPTDNLSLVSKEIQDGLVSFGVIDWLAGAGFRLKNP